MITAKSLISTFGTNDPFEISKSLDIIVFRHQLKGLRGYCYTEDDKDIIVLADDMDDLTERFVCAHELPHICLHKKINRIFMDTRTNVVTNKYENEADRFACQLLFSTPPLLQEETITDKQIAKCLNIPLYNLNNRLINLGIYF